MKTVNLLLGFDTERPYGPFGETEEGKKLREKHLITGAKLNELLNKYNTQRTFFMLGTYIQQSLDQVGQKGLIEVYQPQNSLVEIAQHTYSHPILAPIKTRPDKQPISSEQLSSELKLADTLIKVVLKLEQPIIGLRTPLGYANGLLDQQKITKILFQHGLFYVSSDLRDEDDGLNAPLVKKDGDLRQPFKYMQGIWELPSHGWQDSAFTGESKTKGATDYPKTIKDITDHYIQILKQAKEISERRGSDIFIGLCMHPWAITIYDPKLEVLENLIKFSKDNGVHLLNYREAYENLERTFYEKNS